MKGGVQHRSTLKTVLWTILIVFVVVFIFVPLLFSFFHSSKFGNIARIPIQGVITGDGASSLAQESVSSQTIVQFIHEADENSNVKVILLEINSPGGSAVASDEIASALKQTQKPVVALIREVGASGGYWIASAADHIIANRMSITGSIGVISSYLELSQLMEKYGVHYEQLMAGEYKDLGTPFRELKPDERNLLQAKLDTIHQFFIEEVAMNRNLSVAKVQRIATGEFYLGIEAQKLGLVDELGNQQTAEDYIKRTYNIETIDYVDYQEQHGLLDVLSHVTATWFFHIGQGIGSSMTQHSFPLT